MLLNVRLRASLLRHAGGSRHDLLKRDRAKDGNKIR
jgi:hypothetical protein